MLPVLIEIGSFRLHSYGAMAASAFLIVVLFALRDADARGWPRERLVDMIFWTALAAIAGARGFFFLQFPELVESPWSLVDMRSGGMVFYGAPLVGVPVGLFLLRRYELPIWPIADTFGKLLPMAHGLSRIGCFGAGCCYGKVTEMPWAVTYSHPLSVAPHDVALHPVQLYEAAGLLALSAGLFWLERRKRFDGQILLTWLGLYAVMRTVTELFRGDAERYFVFPSMLGELISTSQAVSAGVLIVVVIGWQVLSGRPQTEG